MPAGMEDLRATRNRSKVAASVPAVQQGSAPAVVASGPGAVSEPAEVRVACRAQGGMPAPPGTRLRARREAPPVMAREVKDKEAKAKRAARDRQAPRARQARVCP